MKKVAIFIHSLKAGGAERIVSYLLQEGCEKFEIHLILLGMHMDYQLPANANIKVVALGNSFGSKYLGVLSIPLLARRLRRYLVANGIQTLLSLLNRPNLIACLVKKSGWQGKVIISERADTLAYYESIRFGWVMVWLVRKYYPSADLVTVISKGIGFSLQSLGISRICVIYNPIYLSGRSKAARSEPPFTFINIARLEPQKNQALLLRAFAALKNRDSRLVILGRGSLQAALQELAITLEIAARVEFAGYQGDVKSWVENADCLVFSSDFEGFGNVLLEAMNSSVPVISTDCPYGPREILAPATDPRAMIQDGIELAEFGILTPVKNVPQLARAMQELMDNVGLRSRYQSAGAARAADFDIKTISQTYFDLF